MDSEPLVSIIIPVYNTRKYIEEALESVLGQTYRQLEIVIIDDGSTDGSDLVCDCYEQRDNRIKVIHQVNKGLSAARNVGLDVVSGQIIAFLDPDDAMQPETIELMVSTMVQDRSDIVMCNYSIHETENRMLPKDIHLDECNSRIINQKDAAIMIAEWKIETAVWNKLYRREIWEELRFPEGRIYEGTYIIYDIFDRAGLISVMDKELMMHRKRVGSICNSGSLKHILDGDFATDYFAQCVKRHSYIPQNYYKEIIRIRYRRLIRSFLQYSYSNPTDRVGQNGIRQNLLELRNRDSLKQCTTLDRIEFYGIKLFPQMMKKLYWLYKRIKR